MSNKQKKATVLSTQVTMPSHYIQVGTSLRNVNRRTYRRHETFREELRERREEEKPKQVFRDNSMTNHERVRSRRLMVKAAKTAKLLDKHPELAQEIGKKVKDAVA